MKHPNYLNETDIHQLQKSSLRWKTRRKVAIVSFASLLIFTFSLFFLESEKIKSLEGIYTQFVIAMTTIVFGYFGFSTWEDKDRKDG